MSGHRARSFGARPARAGLFLLGLASTACSWLVNPEADAPRCAIDAGFDPCEEGMQCVAGRCRTMNCSERDICGDDLDNDCDGEKDEDPIEKVEDCNFLDDDCDGQTDEDFDRDGDGFTWCGDIVHDDTKDCDEINSNVHPKAKEECDGIDNDCNGLTDEFSAGASLCAEGEECIRGRCVVPTCAVQGSKVTCRNDENCVLGECMSRICNNMMCPAGSRCDQATGTCLAPPEKAKNGATCSTNADCKSDLCIDAAALRMPGRTGRICGKACCDDSACEADEACFASGTGARSCLPRTEVPGAKLCSLDRGCSLPERCIIGRVTQTGNEGRPAFNTTLCRGPDPLRDRDFGEACLGNDSCVSGLCVPDPLSALFGVCSVPCQVSSDCIGMYQEQRGFGFSPLGGPPHEYCRVVDLSQLAMGPPDVGDHLAACVMGYDTGEKKFAERCSNNNECADGVCIMGGTGGSGYCAPTCCKDSQCESMTSSSGVRCVPMARGKHYEMRCSL